MTPYDTIIIGGGAAAFSAAIYARRYNMRTLVISKSFGGETALAGPIENYPGFERIDGFELMERMKAQAEKLGTEFVDGDAALAENRYHCFRIKNGKKTYESKTIILAVGMEHRPLGLPNEEILKAKGIHYCATCDGPLYKGKTLGVVGGGDSAVKWASQLSDIGAAHVYLIVRENNLDRAEPINLKNLKTKKNVTILFETEVKELLGKERLESVRLQSTPSGPVRQGSNPPPAASSPFPEGGGKRWGKDEKNIKLQGLFVAIGAVPRGELPKQLGVKINSHGQIDVDPDTMKTNMDGVFAAGDVTNASGSFKQIITGAAQGALAATSAFRDIHEHPLVCELHAVPIAGLLK